LDICLGAQMMARVLDARVGPMAGKEIGYGPLTITHVCRRGDAAGLRWHGEQFALPAGVTSLAAVPNDWFARLRVAA